MRPLISYPLLVNFAHLSSLFQWVWSMVCVSALANEGGLRRVVRGMCIRSSFSAAIVNIPRSSRGGYDGVQSLPRPRADPRVDPDFRT